MSSELTWLRNLLNDFNIKISFAVVYCDNKAVIHIATNPTYHERTKHLEIDMHYVREQVDKGALKLIHVRKHHQLADVFTKYLPRSAFLSFISKLGIENIFFSS